MPLRWLRLSPPQRHSRGPPRCGVPLHPGALHLHFSKLFYILVETYISPSSHTPLQTPASMSLLNSCMYCSINVPGLVRLMENNMHTALLFQYNILSFDYKTRMAEKLPQSSKIGLLGVKNCTNKQVTGKAMTAVLT